MRKRQRIGLALLVALAACGSVNTPPNNDHDGGVTNGDAAVDTPVSGVTHCVFGQTTLNNCTL